MYQVYLNLYISKPRRKKPLKMRQFQAGETLAACPLVSVHLRQVQIRSAKEVKIPV